MERGKEIETNSEVRTGQRIKKIMASRDGLSSISSEPKTDNRTKTKNAIKTSLITPSFTS